MANTSTVANTTSPALTIRSSGTNYINTAAPLTMGQVYTTNNTSAVNWAISNPNPLEPIMTMNPEKTTLEVKGKMVLNGVDLEERLKTIEKILTIPERDVKLEAKHPKLKKMYDEYITALGKYRTFEAIKGDE